MGVGLLALFWLLGARIGWAIVDWVLARVEARDAARALAARNVTPGTE